MFNDIFCLKNSFATTFGLNGDVERVDDSFHSDLKLVLSVDEFHQKTISQEDAMKIFDLVTEAFIRGSRTEHHYCGATYEFDCENLTVVEHIDMENRGEWL